MPIIDNIELQSTEANSANHNKMVEELKKKSSNNGMPPIFPVVWILQLLHIATKTNFEGVNQMEQHMQDLLSHYVSAKYSF
jgi:hypothetical protein